MCEFYIRRIGEGADVVGIMKLWGEEGEGTEVESSMYSSTAYIEV